MGIIILLPYKEVFSNYNNGIQKELYNG